MGFPHGPLLGRDPRTSLPSVHETRKTNGSMLCGDVEPSNLRDSCTGGRDEQCCCSPIRLNQLRGAVRTRRSGPW